MVAAYFSIVGLATMFPGSQEAIIIMGAVLEIGKLVAAVWLHSNWKKAFRFLRFYLLSAVLILSAITSMGIFGFLSKSHVEHSASIEKEESIISQIDQKISRKLFSIEQKENLISQLAQNKKTETTDRYEVAEKLELRINEIKSDTESLIDLENSSIKNYNERLSKLDSDLQSINRTGIFSNNEKYELIKSEQSEERKEISSLKSRAMDNIENIKSNSLSEISSLRTKIDEIYLNKEILSSDKKSVYQSEVDELYSEIEKLENEKFDYGSSLRALETEIGPIKYIIGALQEWFFISVGTEQAIRIIIITLIFVFDPLAILLIISATITYSQIKEKELPPDVKAIRNKLLEEIEEYINDGGIVDHFIERSKK